MVFETHTMKLCRVSNRIETDFVFNQVFYFSAENLI